RPKVPTGLRRVVGQPRSRMEAGSSRWRVIWPYSKSGRGLIDSPRVFLQTHRASQNHRMPFQLVLPDKHPFKTKRVRKTTFRGDNNETMLKTRGFRGTLVSLFIAAVLLVTSIDKPGSSIDLGLTSKAAARHQTPAPYRDAALPIDQRVADLLSRMTLEEKVAQLECLWMTKPQASTAPGNFAVDHGDFSEQKARVVMKDGIGELARQRERKDARQGAIFANAVQKF